MLSVIINIFLFVLVIGVLTFVHELGHFMAAKLIGAQVDEFALGWGPKLVSKKYKGTEYSLRLLPIGGFVKILGDGDPGEEPKKVKKNDDGNLKNKTKLQQMFVMLAGVFMNIIFAVIAYYIVIFSAGWKVPVDMSYEDFKPVGAVMTRQQESVMTYSELVKDGNAEKAGIPTSGEITKINGQTIVYSDTVGEIIKENAGDYVLLEICVDGECDTYPVQVSEEGTIGIMFAHNFTVYMDYSPRKAYAGVCHVINTLNLVSDRFGKIFEQAKSTGDYSEISNSVSGPVGIYFVIDFFKNFGVITFLSIVADLSISLAIMNILPIPALDGGRVLILLVESIFRKDLNPKVEALIINISFILLMVLVVLIMVKDVLNIDNFRSMFS
jgi:regulator of sigma E protease